MNKNSSQFNELILMAEKSKKKGGSMAAVFKLIEELLDFEDKIQECMNAQEITQNKQRIESFMSEIDKMYDELFQMARGGIANIRDQRGGIERGVEVEEGNDECEEDVDVEVDKDISVSPVADKRRTPIMLNVPQIPKM